MLPQVRAPNALIPVEPLNQAAFSSFGTVIQNPGEPAAGSADPPNMVRANQGTALKYIDISHLNNHYDLAPSGKAAKAVMNMFVCSPRRLQPLSDTRAAFPVSILERHPFTPQTFIPVGLSPDDSSTAYLVIVAPTLPTAAKDGAESRPPPYPQQAPRRKRSLRQLFSLARPSPFSNTTDPPSPTTPLDISVSDKPKGTGLPDLSRLKAFVANGSQSVTYGPGTWHAPMVALGARSIDFVVVQYANGVSLEDCQEVGIEDGPGGEGLKVVVEMGSLGRGPSERARL